MQNDHTTLVPKHLITLKDFCLPSSRPWLFIPSPPRCLSFNTLGGNYKHALTPFFNICHSQNQSKSTVVANEDGVYGICSVRRV